MAEFNEEAQRAKVKAGFKGGPFNKSPILHPKMTFVDGWPGEVKAKLDFAKTISGSQRDSSK
jgi:hypothetical protein